MLPKVRWSWVPEVQATGAVSSAVSVEVVVTDPSGLVVVVVVVVFVVAVVCVSVFVVSVPGGAIAVGLMTVSVGCTLGAGTTVVASSVAATGFEAVASAGAGVAWAPTGTVFDSSESGSVAGRLPT